jgi:hypothetical protein
MLIKIRFILLSLFLVSILGACATQPTPTGSAQALPPFPAVGTLGDSPQVFPVETGWVDGQAIEYYNMGTNAPLNPNDPTRVMVAPGWLLVTSVNTDGTPNRIEGQYTIFDVLPGEAGHSDLWQIHFVFPPDDYQANTFRSVDEIDQSGYQVDKSLMLVNCPFAPLGSSLGDNSRELKPGWVDGVEFDYFDFGVTSAVPGEMYAFITGFDSNHQPLLIPGQHFIFNARRGDPGYSDFWLVHWVLVDTSYQADAIRNVTDIPAEKVTVSNLVVNYPHR